MKPLSSPSKLIETDTRLVSWRDFRSYMARTWQQGEHLSIIGPTGKGKTTLAYALLPLRDWTIILGTKTKDTSLEKFGKKYRYTKQTRFRPTYEKSHYILWPKYERLGDEKKQQGVFAEAMQDIFVQGSWTVYVDETWYFENRLKLGNVLENFWSQSRSNDITFMAATQRPRNVPVMMYDQCTHLFVFKMIDAYGRKRLGEIGGIDSRNVADEVAHLQGYQFLYVNLADDTVPRMISEVEL